MQRLVLLIGGGVIEEGTFATRTTGRQRSVPCRIQAFKPLINVLHACDVDVADIRHGKRLQPLKHPIPLIVVDEGLRVGLVDRVREKQRHQLLKAVDASDARFLRAVTQQRYLFDTDLEQLLRSEQLQFMNLCLWLIERMGFDDLIKQLFSYGRHCIPQLVVLICERHLISRRN
ncbi:hypothetical protein D3C84_853640 [compost metagenome]